MASSPTEEALRQIANAYDRALEAIGRSDLDRVQSLVDDAERVLVSVQHPGQDSKRERELRRRGMESHGRLVAAMGGSRREVLLHLQKIRQGRKMLKTYGHRGESVGTRLRSQG